LEAKSPEQKASTQVKVCSIAASREVGQTTMNLMNIISTMVGTLGIIVPDMESIEITIVTSVLFGFLAYNHFYKNRYQQVLIFDRDMTTMLMAYLALWCVVGIHKTVYWKELYGTATEGQRVVEILNAKIAKPSVSLYSSTWYIITGWMSNFVLMWQWLIVTFAVISIIWLYKGVNVVRKWRDVYAIVTLNRCSQNVDTTPTPSPPTNTRAEDELRELRAEVTSLKNQLETEKKQNIALRAANESSEAMLYSD